jgi:hypothetical protein
MSEFTDLLVKDRIVDSAYKDFMEWADTDPAWKCLIVFFAWLRFLDSIELEKEGV